MRTGVRARVRAKASTIMGLRVKVTVRWHDWAQPKTEGGSHSWLGGLSDLQLCQQP